MGEKYFLSPSKAIFEVQTTANYLSANTLHWHDKK